MPDLRANGVRLYYEEHGEGAPILCIHGSSSSAMLWRDAAVEALSSLGRVIVYDRRGCTRSERPEPLETSVAQQAEDAAALLDGLDATPAVVIGRSYGGEVATELALRHRDHVRALILLEGFPRLLDPEVAAFAASVDRAVEKAAATDPSRAAEALHRQVLGKRWDAYPDELRAMFTANSPAVLAEARGAWLEVSEAELGELDVPTLLVAAASSPPAFRRGTERTAAALPDAHVALIEGDHLIDPGSPEVLRFVESVLAA